MFKSLLILSLTSASPCFATFDLPSIEQMEIKLQERAQTRYGGQEVLESVRMLPPGSRVVGTHILFNSKADAVAYMKATEQDTKDSFRAQEFKIDENHPDTEKLQEYVNLIWSAFNDLFPTYVKNLEAPHVLVVKTEQTTAFVPSFDGKSLHIVVVMTGMIKKAGGVHELDKITGNLAHEVAHSVFSHGTPAQERRIQRFYLQDEQLMGFESGLGKTQQEKNEIAQINAVMNSYVSSIENIGEITSEKLDGLPSPAYATPLLQRVWSVYRQQAMSSPEPSCATERTGYVEWSRQFEFSPYLFKYVILPGTDVEGTSTKLVTNGTQCFDNSEDFARSYAKVVGVPAARLLQDPDFIRMNNIVMRSDNALTGLRDLVRTERKRMNEISLQPFFKHLGFYTTEQHADDASAITHAYMERNAGAFGELLRVSMSRSGEGFPQKCDKELEQGLIPDIGSYTIAHHSNCYRLWNFARMKKKMSTMNKNQIKLFAEQFAKKSIR